MATVLAIDDHLETLQLLEVILTKSGYTPVVALNGSEGLKKAKAVEPDLILLDVMMPDMDGWEVCRRIREVSDVPIIMLTAKNKAEDVIHGFTTGADEYLIKPIRFATLPARIEALLRRTRWQKGATPNEIKGAKKDILNVVTHELRTPPSLIMNALDLAMQTAFENDRDAQVKFIQEARQNAVAMRWLVDDLLLLVRMENGIEIFRRPVAVTQEIKKLVDEQKDEIEACNLHVYYKCADDLKANVDYTLFRHAMHHLITNAVKFSSEGGKISIHADRKKGSFRIAVVDNGPGIDSEYQDQVFMPFYQVNQGDHRKYGGLGVGLTIAREIAHAHEGQIKIKSAPGKGTMVSMSFSNSPVDWDI